MNYILAFSMVNYTLFVLIQLAASLGPRFYLNIYKCKHISETGAQQVRVKCHVKLNFFYLLLIWTSLISLHFVPKMLLDTQAVKTILLDIPALGKQVIF